MVESWAEGRQHALEQGQEAAASGGDENLKTPEQRRKSDIGEECLWEQGLEVLKDRTKQRLAFGK